MNFNIPKQGWSGNWAEGERPQGYISTTERLRELSEKGFSPQKALGTPFSLRYLELMEKAKTGALEPDETEEFLDRNKTLIASMDEFELSGNKI